jgi:hypothetical protein
MTLTDQLIDLEEDEALLEEDDWSYPPELESYSLDDIGVSMINLFNDNEDF